MRTALALVALALGAATLAPAADAQRRAPRDTTDRVERPQDVPRARRDQRPRIRGAEEARRRSRRGEATRRDTTDWPRLPRGQRPPRRDATEQARRLRHPGRFITLDTLAGESEAPPTGGGAARRTNAPGAQRGRRPGRGDGVRAGRHQPPGSDISTIRDIVPAPGRDAPGARSGQRSARRPGDAPAPPDEGGYIIDDWIWGAQDADREPRPEADGQAARTRSRPRAAGATPVSGRRRGQSPAGPGGAPPAAGDYDRADHPNGDRPDGYEYGIGYVVSGPTTPTLISGAGGPDQIDKEPGNGAMLYLVGGAEEADAPCAFLLGWARWNAPRNGRQKYFETTTNSCDDKDPWWRAGSEYGGSRPYYEDHFFSTHDGRPYPFNGFGGDDRHIAGVPALTFAGGWAFPVVEPQPIRAAHAIQACLNRAGDRLKGLRVWGAHVGRVEPGSVEPDGALFGEFERPNCHEWAAKRSCPEGEVAVGITVHDDEGREFEASGVSLTCAAPRPIDLPVPVYDAD